MARLIRLWLGKKDGQFHREVYGSIAFTEGALLYERFCLPIAKNGVDWMKPHEHTCLWSLGLLVSGLHTSSKVGSNMGAITNVIVVLTVSCS